MGQRRYNVKVFVDAIPGSEGIVSVIADRVGCDSGTVNTWIKRHPTLQELYNKEKDFILNVAESLITTNIKLHRNYQIEKQVPVDTADAKWLLSKRNKKEYGESLALEGSLTIDIPEGKSEEYLARLEKAIHLILRND